MLEKICLLAHFNSIHTRRWAIYFRDQGYQVSVISLMPAQPIQGIHHHIINHNWKIRYERANWHYLLQLPKIRQLIHEINPDILNAHFLSSYGFLGAIIKPKHLPFVVSLHGSDILIFPQKSPIHRWISSYVLRQADLITSVAQHMSQKLPQYLNTKIPVLTLQYGIDTTLFNSSSRTKSELPICLSNRNLVSTSNLETILRAATILKEQESPIQIKIFGDGELEVSLRALSNEMNLSNVQFIGRIDQAEMAKEYQLAPLYVSMSRSDGMSLSLLEAMACRSFPILSDIPANREWVEDGVNGYLVPADSVSVLASRLQLAWKQTEFRQKAVEHNYNLVREKGDYHKNMKRIERQFVKLHQEYVR